MRFWLPVCALLLFVPGIAVLTWHVSCEPYERSAENHATPDDPVSLPFSDQQRNPATNNQSSAITNPPRWCAAIERPDWWSILVITITAVVIGWQAVETRRAASATLLNAQALVNSERAKLIVDFVMHGDYLADVVAKNIGRSTARITYLYSQSGLADWNETLPEVPVYVASPGLGVDSSDWIDPTSTSDISMDGPFLRIDFTGFQDRTQSRRREKCIITYGCFRYDDGITEEIREVRFCYRSWFEDDNMPLHIQSFGPRQYHQQG